MVHLLALLIDGVKNQHVHLVADLLVQKELHVERRQLVLHYAFEDRQQQFASLES